VAHVTASASLNVGFLTVLHEPAGYLGGYLVTNSWGRPLEFRVSTPVQPNRVQQILYGGTLQPYICADLIGKTLIEKTATAVQLLVTDREPVLELRPSVNIPVAWLAPGSEPLATALGASGAEVRAPTQERGAILCHPSHTADANLIRELLVRIDATMDLAEPFQRIREGMTEARRMGVAARG
jgi:hypothetical protein